MQAARRYGRTVSGHTTVAGGGIAGPALARALRGTEIPVPMVVRGEHGVQSGHANNLPAHATSAASWRITAAPNRWALSQQSVDRLGEAGGEVADVGDQLGWFVYLE